MGREASVGLRGLNTKECVCVSLQTGRRGGKTGLVLARWCKGVCPRQELKRASWQNDQHRDACGTLPTRKRNQASKYQLADLVSLELALAQRYQFDFATQMI